MLKAYDRDAYCTFATLAPQAEAVEEDVRAHRATSSTKVDPLPDH